MVGLRRAAACIAFLGLSVGAAQATGLWGDNPVSLKDGPGGSYWVVTVGGYGAAEPAFPGAKSYMGTGRLIFDFYRAGDREWLTLPNDAASFTLYEAGNFRAGVAGDFLPGRFQNSGDAVHGLHDVDYTVEVGGFLEFYPVPFVRTRAELLQGVTGAEGFTANLMADFIYRPDPQWLLTVGPRLKFVDDQYNAAFFSISPLDSFRSSFSGLPFLRPFTAAGGLYSAGVDATVRYNLTERVSLRAFAEWNRLQGDAADNPLVQLRGTEDQWQVGVGAAYKFNFAF
jgi:outer membrane protein